MYRTLVIGVAGRGRVWTRAVLDHSQFELVGMADLNAEEMAVTAEKIGAPDVAQYTDFHEPLRDGKVDVVINAAATTAHYAITRDVLDAGAHCLVEKPFTLDMTEAEKLVEQADAAGLTLVVGQNYRFTALCRFVADLIASGDLGELMQVTGQFHRNRPPRPSDLNIQFPMLFIQGVHHLDWLASIVPGPLQLLHAQHHLPADSQWTSPTICHVQMAGAGGAPVTYAGSYDARGEISSYTGMWRFAFTKGDLIIDNDQRVHRVRDTADGPVSETVYELSGDEPSGESRLLDSVHAGIAGDAEPPTSGRANLAVLQLLFDVCAGRSEAATSSSSG